MAPPGGIQDLFAGTEAVGWARGAAGIEPLTDDPAYLAVRRALVLARVDCDPAAFLDFVAPESRRVFGRDALLPSLVTLRKPREVRVSGSMFEATDQHDRLVVMTDYRFAYALDNPDGSPSVVFLTAQADFQLRDDGLTVLAATTTERPGG
ncbi:hypothetical protein [Lentzea sp. NPDC051838]|uniref:hypothetical protein n=1 Tax=Lentzea sp. NPDC051838 TaxID=3154849 RepID=UPI0034300D7E